MDVFPYLFMQVLFTICLGIRFFPESFEQPGLKGGIDLYPPGKPDPVYHVLRQCHHGSFRAGGFAWAPVRIRACVMR